MNLDEIDGQGRIMRGGRARAGVACVPSGSLFARSAARWRKHICVFFAVAAAASPEGGRKDLGDLEVGEFAKWKESRELRKSH